MAKTVYILRGLPGSGKTTWAKQQIGAVICSADDYFLRNGQYKFNRNLLANAHADCKAMFRKAIFDDADVIIVDNTNTAQREYKYYVDNATANGYDVVIKVFDCDIATSIARNIHGVPELAIHRMHDRFE